MVEFIEAISGAATGDAREWFLAAYNAYQDASRVVSNAQGVYPGSCVEMMHSHWFNDDAALTAAMNTTLAIREFADLRERIKKYPAGARFHALYGANVS